MKTRSILIAAACAIAVFTFTTPAHAQDDISCYWQGQPYICCNSDACSYCKYDGGVPTQCGLLSAQRQPQAIVLPAIKLAMPPLPISGCGMQCPPPTPTPTPIPTPTPPQINPIVTAHQLNPNCPTGCVGQESPGSYLALRIGPVFSMSAAEFVYVLPYPLHVTHLDAWDDNGYGNVIEHDTHLQIQFPDGTWTEYFVQYDNHSPSLPGQVQRGFDADLTLPAGTKIIIYHNAINCIAPVDQCGYDSLWQLRAK